MKFERVYAKASPWTFSIPPIKALVDRYVGDGVGWVDPFAGYNSPAEFTNDMHPNRNARWHMEAEEFCRMIAAGRQFNGVLFDPPYSLYQISKHYAELGSKATPLDTSDRFYNRVMDAIYTAVKPGGYVLSFGWNSNGFGKHRGFEPVELLIVRHGGHRYDTLCNVEQREFCLDGNPKDTLCLVECMPAAQRKITGGNDGCL